MRLESAPGDTPLTIANSHLYAIDFSSSIDLQKNYSGLFSVTRLPDLVPRISKGTFLWHRSSLTLFGGVQTTFPIYLANGSYSHAHRVEIDNYVFSHDISNEGTWGATSSLPVLDSPLPGLPIGNTSLGNTAKAFDERSDDGNGVLWYYGGGLQQKWLGMTEFQDLWRTPGDCDKKHIIACKQTTITSGNSTAPRGKLDGTMVWVDAGAKGVLVLFGGSVDNSMVRTCFIKEKSNLVCRKENSYGIVSI